jgi:hypothetical protein
MKTEEMYTHENESFEFRQGYREGLEKALELVTDYMSDLKADKKINEALWVSVAKEWIDDELSMYQVGDEE